MCPAGWSCPPAGLREALGCSRQVGAGGSASRRGCERARPGKRELPPHPRGREPGAARNSGESCELKAVPPAAPGGPGTWPPAEEEKGSVRSGRQVSPRPCGALALRDGTGGWVGAPSTHCSGAAGACRPVSGSSSSRETLAGVKDCTSARLYILVCVGGGYYYY